MGRTSAAATVSPALDLPARRRRSQAPHISPPNCRTLLARIVATVPASDRLLRSADEGADDYIVMSADGRFSMRVRIAIDPTQLGEQSLGDGKLVVNWSRATMSHGDARVSLSRTELRLLSGLLDGNGKIVPRSSLIARAWPKDKMLAADRENALSVYVWFLRKRLAAIGLGSGLQTVRGVGYRMVL